MRFQRVIFPDGLTYHMNEGFGTAVVCPVFNVLEQIEVERTKVAPHFVASWNRIVNFLRVLRRITPELESRFWRFDGGSGAAVDYCHEN